MTKRSLVHAIVAALVLVTIVAGTVTAGIASRKIPQGSYIIYQTFVHDGSTECPTHETDYKVKMKLYVRNASTTSFIVDDVWVTYEVENGHVWTDLFFMFGSFGQRWPTNGYMWQGEDLFAGETRTYYYNVNKTFQKDAVLENRSMFGDPFYGASCPTTDQWQVWVY